MCASPADCAAARLRALGFKENRVKVGKVLQFQARDFLADETLDRLEGGKLFAVHQRESVADVLCATGTADILSVNRCFWRAGWHRSAFRSCR